HQGYIVASYGPLTSTVRDESKTAEKRRKGKEAAVGQLRQRLQEFAAEELGGEAEAAAILGDIEVVVGSPVAEILKAADRLNADMLVFGSHSKGFIQHTFLGSVAEKVLRKTRRPTLIVPPPFN
ncbi:MAG: universal stress protein, partial [Desulfuromonadales bacterium]|nr:universal stress protein [Desulfuromonadales bacterium]